MHNVKNLVEVAFSVLIEDRKFPTVAWGVSRSKNEFSDRDRRRFILVPVRSGSCSNSIDVLFGNSNKGIPMGQDRRLYFGLSETLSMSRANCCKVFLSIVDKVRDSFRIFFICSFWDIFIFRFYDYN